jgi:hypothetical protein
MNTIWKWPLYPGRTELSMPIDAQLLTVQMQGDTPCLWALVDDHLPKVSRAFEIYGTGQRVPENHGQYVATFQMNDGALVFHVFETKQTRPAA